MYSKTQYEYQSRRIREKERKIKTKGLSGAQLTLSQKVRDHGGKKSSLFLKKNVQMMIARVKRYKRSGLGRRESGSWGAETLA
ncbi:MAG: hypothetical protein PHD13_01850 [Methanocellales archaeon]|nr:hypothetical protein [Methanocellales archaeon]